jgi:hypothetical protein
MGRRRVGVECIHPVAADHKTAGGWRCTACRRVGPWGKTWAYYGSWECYVCWQASVEFVTCSETCRATMRRNPVATEAQSNHVTQPEEK